MSPFVSIKQKKWMYANKPEMAKRWEKEARRKRLADKIRRKKKQKV